MKFRNLMVILCCTYLKVFQVVINVSLLEHGSDSQPLLGSGLALDVVIVPVLAGGHSLLGTKVLNTLHCLQLKVCTYSTLKINIFINNFPCLLLLILLSLLHGQSWNNCSPGMT